MRYIRLLGSFIGLCLMILSVRPAFAQDDPNFETGLKPFGSYQAGKIDTVDLLDRGLSVDIPLISYPQKGGKLRLAFSLHYVNAGYYYTVGQIYDDYGDVIGTTTDWEFSSPIAGWTIRQDGIPGGQGVQTIYPPPNQDGGSVPGYEVGSITMSDGAVHQLAPLSLDGAWRTIDGSNFETYEDANGWETVDANGIIYTNAGLVASGFGNFTALKETDTNGNTITATQGGQDQGWHVIGWTDTMGRTISTPYTQTDLSRCPSVSGAVTGASEWDLPGPNGGTYPLLFCSGGSIPWTYYYWDTNNGQGTGWQAQSTGNVWALQSLVLPDNTYYTFQYTADGYLNLSQVTFPTGGHLCYTWDNENNGGQTDFEFWAWLLTRQQDTSACGPSSPTWTYSNGIVTDPAGNDTVHTFGNIPNSYATLETQTQYYQGNHTGGTLKKTINSNYVSLSSTDINLQPGAFLTQVTTAWSNGQTSTIKYAPDSVGFAAGQTVQNPATYQWQWDYVANVLYGKPVSVQEYDYDGSLSRTTNTTYKFQNDPNYLNANLLDLPASVQITGVGPGSYTTYGFDESGSPQCVCGNQTSVNRWLSTTGAYLTTNSVYDPNGRVTSVRDPKNNTPTTYQYDGPGYAGSGPTSVTNALGQTTTYTYDFNTGLITSAKDPNGQVTGLTTNYQYDGMVRTTEIDYPGSPDRGQSLFSYPNANEVQISEKIDNTGRERTSNLLVDGFGREIQRNRSNGESMPFDQVDTCYDAMGRVGFKSYPYQSTGLSTPTCSGIGDSFTYDVFGRTATITHSDGSTVSTGYADPCNTVTDESGHTRESCTDALGRLTTVIENPGDLNYTTTYAYDALDNLTSVADGDQQRSFVYDSVSRLTSATNPESGVTTYTYDADGNIITKTDARNVTTCYGDWTPSPPSCNALTGYDPLNRVLKKTYSDGTPTAHFQYDQTSNWGWTLNNTIGRLSTVYTDGAQSGTIYSYNPMGRTVVNAQCTPQNCGWGGYSITSGYDLIGDLTSYNNGEGVSFTHTFNLGGRLTQVTSSLADSQHPSNLISAVHYNAFGKEVSATLGNGATEALTYTDRGWVQSATTSGNILVSQPTPSTGSATTSGSEQSQGGDPATAGSGSGTVGGNEQNRAGNPATAGSASGTVNGAEQSMSTNPAPGTGTVTISGDEQIGWYDPCEIYIDEGDEGDWDACMDEYPNGETVYDQGDVYLSVNGVQSYIFYDDGDTDQTIATRLASAVNSNYSAPVTASASGTTITLTAKTSGASTDYSLSSTSYDDSGYFDSPSFYGNPSGSNLTGGTNGGTLYDAGAVWVTVNGVQCATSYANGDTSSSVASNLVNAVNSCAGSPVTAGLSGTVVNLVAKTTGAGTNYSLSSGSSSSQGFSPSFNVGVSGGALTGGADATPTVYDAGSVWVTVNGVQCSTGYGNGDTFSSVASDLTNAINSCGGSPVTANLSGTVVYLTAKSTGSSTNYSLSSGASSSQGFSPSFNVGVSGGALTGGSDGTATLYDAGTVSVTVNGVQCSASYANGDTSLSVATNLANAVNSCSGSPVSASAAGTTVTLASKTAGASTNYSLSASSVSNQGFASPSFSVGVSGGYMTGGQDQSTQPGTVYSYSVGYAPNGDVLSATDSINGNWSYAYDQLDRITSVQQSGQPAYTYSYDRYGNRWNDLLNGVCTAGTTFCITFDANNHTSAVTYDAAGNVISDNAHARYYYDAENRLVQVDGTLGNCSSATACYVYDANGRRTEKTAYGATVDYAYDVEGHQIDEEGSSGTAWNRGEIYAGGEHLATYSSGGSGTTYFDHSDWLGTERVRTNMSALGCEWITSLPFGDGLNDSGPCTDASPMHFTGKQHDPESGLDDFGARYSSSSLGRFMSPDPSGVSINAANPQTWNRYAYALNNPLTYVDRNGLWPTFIHNEIYDAVFGGRLTKDQLNLIEAVSASVDSLHPGQDKENSSWHAMCAPGQSTASCRSAIATQIQVHLAAAKSFGDVEGLSNTALTYFTVAGHALTDEGSPTHTSPDGTPMTWCGLSVRCAFSDLAHVTGEADESDSWYGIGVSVRNLVTNFFSTFPEDAAKVFQGASASSVVQQAINIIVTSYFDVHVESPQKEEAARQCAMGNSAACDNSWKGEEDN